MRKFLIGCGVVFACVVLLNVLGFIAVTQWFKKRVPDNMERVHAQLEERFGPPETYVPPLDGVPPAERVGRFVAIRDSLVTQRAVAAARIASMITQVQRARPADRPWIAKAVEAAGFVRGGSEMAIAFAQYVSRRDHLLMNAEMGEGEYRWLYGLAYFGWLGWVPLADTTATAALRKIDTDLVDDIEGARSRVGRLLRKQFENQQQALEAKAVRTPAEEAALAALRTELPLSESNDAFPFVGRVPKPWTVTLEPHRDRLVATLPQNMIEVALDVIRFEPKSKRGIHVSR
jgi:hypothetical protein